MLTLRRLAAAALLLLALTAAVAAVPGIGLADYLEDYGSGDDAPESRILGVYEVELDSGEATGIDVEEAYARVTPARGGRLRVRTSLRASAFGDDVRAEVAAAPCTSMDPEVEDLRCARGRAETVTFRHGAGQVSTSEVVIPAPRAPSQAIRVSVAATRRAAVWMTIPSSAWTGRQAGQAVGGRTPAGAAVHSPFVDFVLRTWADGTAEANSTARVDNDGPGRATAELALRRCAQLIPACRAGGDKATVAAADWENVGRLADVGRPRAAAPVLRLNVMARPSNAIVAEAALPWPARSRR